MVLLAKKSLINQVKHLWNKYNVEYFGGALSEPTIRIVRATRYYGDFVVTESSGRPTLRLSNRLNNSPEQLRDTLLHEMVHQYLWELGLPNWDDHGEAFKNEAGRIGICIDGTH